jgi:hypothetical protein
MNLHIVAYPELSPVDYEMIQSLRREYNSLYNIIGPHFTFVFSTPGVSEVGFIEDVKKTTAGFRAINFCIRSATINKDVFSNNYDAFLVPDEGHSQMLKLHDALYSQTLAPQHRMDIPYVPHISVANSHDPYAIKKIVGNLNSQNLTITGSITSLDIINYENRVVTTVGKIYLPA